MTVRDETVIGTKRPKTTGNRTTEAGTGSDADRGPERRRGIRHDAGQKHHHDQGEERHTDTLNAFDPFHAQPNIIITRQENESNHGPLHLEEHRQLIGHHVGTDRRIVVTQFIGI